MKLFLPLAGTAVLLLAATAFILKMKSPAPAEASQPAPSQMRTKTVRSREIVQAGTQGETGTEASPSGQTISSNRRDEHSATNAPSSSSRHSHSQNTPVAAGRKQTRAFAIERTPGMPLVYQIDEQSLAAQFPDVPSSTLASIKEEFEKEIDADHLEPSSPEYARRWISAEVLAESRLRAYYGWGAYAGMQQQAALEKLNE